MVRILHIEDDPLDSELAKHLLQSEGMQVEVERVHTLPAFNSALANQEFQLILSDYTIPGMSALDALRRCRQLKPDVPFIFLSGTIGEERAIEALKLGATDYVIKDHPHRLGSIVKRALQESEERMRRKEGEQELAKATSRLNGIISSAMDAIISVDAKQNVVLFNPAAEKMFRILTERALGRSIGDFIRERSRGLHPNPIEQFAKTGISNRSFEGIGALMGLRANGEEFPIEASISQAEAGGETLFTIILRDITQRKQAEETLRQNEEHLRLFIDHAPAAIAMFDRNMNYIAVSQRWLADYGLQGRKIIGRSHYELFPEIGQDWKDVHQRCLSGAVESCEEEIVHRADGTQQWVRWEVRPWFTTSFAVGGITIFSEDITERKLAQVALKHNEEWFRNLADAIPQMAWIARADGFILWYNKRWYEYTGKTQSEMEGWGWESIHAPEMLANVLAKWNRSIATGTPFEMVFPLKGADGRYRTFLTQARPFKNAAGKVMQWFGTNTDITVQKEFEAELERVVKERTARLNETIGELEAFSYSLSHDMRAPLRAISAYAHILLEEHSESLNGDSGSLLQKIISAGERMDRLITDVLSLTQISHAQLNTETIHVEELLRQIIEVRPEMQAPRAEISIQAPLLPVMADRASLTQCLTNLMSNAIKYVPQSVTPQVRIWTALLPDHPHFVRLWIEDNGIGIAHADQQKIFEMFHRLHSQERFEGTGIGLSIVRKAVQRMGGKVGVESQPGKGSQFWVELPEGE